MSGRLIFLVPPPLCQSERTLKSSPFHSWNYHEEILLTPELLSDKLAEHCWSQSPRCYFILDQKRTKTIDNKNNNIHHFLKAVKESRAETSHPMKERRLR